MRLYEANETEFNHNGLGVLSDAADAEVTEERNGAFELTMQYPSGGWLFSELKNRRIIYCPAYPGGTPQPFRIYRITKPMGGLVTVYAEHISYDLSGVMLSRFSAGSAAEAFAKLPQYAVGNNPFTFFTDKSTQAVFQVTAPASIRSKLGGSEGSLLDVYGGEYVFDGFTVKLLNERGQNRGVSIRYGKNLTDLTQEENIQSVYTGVYPYWAKEEDYFELPEKTVNAEGDFGFTRLMPLDLSSEFEEKPSAERLRAKAQEYMKANKIGVPKVSLTVSFFPLEQSEEYKDLALLETVYLCDTVNVEFSALGVSATAKVVKTVYDVFARLSWAMPKAILLIPLSSRSRKFKRSLLTLRWKMPYKTQRTGSPMAAGILWPSRMRLGIGKRLSAWMSTIWSRPKRFGAGITAVLGLVQMAITARIVWPLHRMVQLWPILLRWER